jgi:hypothetical protein
MQLLAVETVLLSQLVLGHVILPAHGLQQTGECIIDAETGSCQPDQDQPLEQQNSPPSKDLDEECESWAGMGECDVNPR